MSNKLRRISMLTFLGILPLQIAVAPKDSAETGFRVTGGFGQYAQIIRGCEGEVLDKEKMPFSEIGLSIDHKTRSCFRLGLNTSHIMTQKGSEYDQDLRRVEIATFNPFINAEWKYFALGGGYFWASKSIMEEQDDAGENLFSAYLRIGNLKSVYVDASFLHTPPIYSGSFLKIGLGSRPMPALGLWLGAGFGPYDKGGLVVKSNIRLQQNLYLDALIRFGESEGVSESAAGLGLTYKIRH